MVVAFTLPARCNYLFHPSTSKVFIFYLVITVRSIPMFQVITSTLMPNDRSWSLILIEAIYPVVDLKLLLMDTLRTLVLLLVLFAFHLRSQQRSFA
jgi:hypothetical protein